MMMTLLERVVVGVVEGEEEAEAAVAAVAAEDGRGRFCL